MRLRNKFKFAFFTIALSCAVVGLVVFTTQKSGNFNTLIPDVAYRSGQPSRENFEKKISTCRSRSVLNLRGSSKLHWYSYEMA